MDQSEFKQFLQLCGARDRLILEDIPHARFSDLVRFLYLTDVLDFMEINCEIYQTLYGRDPLRLEAYLDTGLDIDDARACPNAWEEDFYDQAPTQWAKREFRRRMAKEY